MKFILKIPEALFEGYACSDLQDFIDGTEYYQNRVNAQHASAQVCCFWKNTGEKNLQASLINGEGKKVVVKGKSLILEAKNADGSKFPITKKDNSDSGLFVLSGLPSGEHEVKDSKELF
jgi:hypothetical protein